MDKTWLNYVNLSDDYERRARFLPGVLSLLPLLPLSAVVDLPIQEWIKILLLGVGGGAVIAVAISHLASALGNRIQRQLWPDWPHDSPTNLWLLPQNGTVSKQQKEKWYGAIKRTTGLDIEAVARDGSPDETRAVINDAITALRDRLRKAPEADRLKQHNIDYGFARNLTGLRPIWILFSLASAIGCCSNYIWHEGSLLVCGGCIIIFIAAVILGFAVFPAYVRQKAHYYAEAFYGAVVAIDEPRRHRKS